MPQLPTSSAYGKFFLADKQYVSDGHRVAGLTSHSVALAYPRLGKLDTQIAHALGSATSLQVAKCYSVYGHSSKSKRDLTNVIPELAFHSTRIFPQMTPPAKHRPSNAAPTSRFDTSYRASFGLKQPLKREAVLDGRLSWRHVHSCNSLCESTSYE